MKASYKTLSLLFCAGLLTMCTKDPEFVKEVSIQENPPIEVEIEEEPQYDTIATEAYFPARPGSWWKYQVVVQTGKMEGGSLVITRDTSIADVTVEQDLKLHHFITHYDVTSPGNEVTEYSDTNYVPVVNCDNSSWRQLTQLTGEIYGYQRVSQTTPHNVNKYSKALVPFFSESLGDKFKAYPEIFGSSQNYGGGYYSIICIDNDNVVLQSDFSNGPYWMEDRSMTFKKDVGLIHLMNTVSVDTNYFTEIELLEYHLSD